MYLSYYNLKAKPFEINTDPKFLWLGKKQKEALATMRYGILYNVGSTVVTGDVGTGKSTLVTALIYALTKDLGGKIILAKIDDPGLEILDFFNLIANAYGIGGPHTTKGTFLAAFNGFLHASYSNHKKVVLIIDEAQRLSPELLEEIRHLSNIEKENRKVLNVVFVAQNEFTERLLDDRNRALRQRISVNYNIDALTENETRKYIFHRLKVAGLEKEVFSSNAILEIFLFSAGTPRLINIICDRALVSGFVDQKKLIEADVIEECAEALHLSGENIPILRDRTEQGGLSRSEKRLHAGSAVVYVPIVTLLAVFLGYLYYPGGFDQTIESAKESTKASIPIRYTSEPIAEEASLTRSPASGEMASNEEVDLSQTAASTDVSEENTSQLKEAQEIRAELPRSRPEKGVSEILGQTGARSLAKVTTPAAAEQGDSLGSFTASRAQERGAPGEESGTPDPGEVIDWLLKTKNR